MKVKYEVEADSTGYVERVLIDGKLEWEATHKRTKYGSARTKGKDAEDVLDQELADELPTFLGLTLAQYAGDLE